MSECVRERQREREVKPGGITSSRRHNNVRGPQRAETKNSCFFGVDVTVNFLRNMNSIMHKQSIIFMRICGHCKCRAVTTSEYK